MLYPCVLKFEKFDTGIMEKENKIGSLRKDISNSLSKLSAQLSQLVTETSSLSDPRRVLAVSYSVRLEPDLPQGVDDFI